MTSMRMIDGRFFAGAVTLLMWLALAATARAQGLDVDINKGQIDPLPIAITAFVGTSPEAAQSGADIAGVIANNLGRSGYFRPLPPESFIEQITNFDQEPRFGDWRQINAQGTGHRPDAQGRRSPQGCSSSAVGRSTRAEAHRPQYHTSPESWRRIAHIISDKIYERLTGEKGYFDSARRVRRRDRSEGQAGSSGCAMMDQDGANVRAILPDGKRISC
jgi:TolB protein